MPNFENCFIILKSKMSHLFVSPSLDNKRRRFKRFHCAFLFCTPNMVSGVPRQQRGPQAIMEVTVMVVGCEQVGIGLCWCVCVKIH